MKNRSKIGLAIAIGIGLIVGLVTRNIPFGLVIVLGVRAFLNMFYDDKNNYEQ